MTDTETTRAVNEGHAEREVNAEARAIVDELHDRGYEAEDVIRGAANDLAAGKITASLARAVTAIAQKWKDDSDGVKRITITREQLTETLRFGGIAYHREHDKEWRDNPWKDGISVDLDGDALDFLVDYIATHAEHNCGEHDEDADR